MKIFLAAVVTLCVFLHTADARSYAETPDDELMNLIDAYLEENDERELRGLEDQYGRLDDTDEELGHDLRELLAGLSESEKREFLSDSESESSDSFLDARELDTDTAELLSVAARYLDEDASSDDLETAAVFKRGRRLRKIINWLKTKGYTFLKKVFKSKIFKKILKSLVCPCSKNKRPIVRYLCKLFLKC